MASNPHVRTVITCAMPNCGRTRGDVNHWLQAYIGTAHIEIHAWRDDELSTPGTLPLCGDECAHRLLSQFLTRLKNGEPVVSN